MKIKAGIVGGAGYTAGELIRILLQHPDVDLTVIESKSHAGEFVYKAHPDLEGESELKFTNELNEKIDVLFLCSGHGKSSQWLESHSLKKGIKVIDLSSDFRIKAKRHGFIYGLPELNKEHIKEADFVANPGCFATAIQLALLPLAASGDLADLHISAVTGSTGAGQQPSDTTHFSWRSQNISVYKPFIHQHVKEIRQSLVHLQPNFKGQLNFIPMRGAFSRGILAAVYLDVKKSLEELKDQYQEFYSPHPFVQLTETNPDVKRVVNTNKAMLYLDQEGDKLLIISVIDNLLKGASGQAVQNMNIMFGLSETTGLKFKPVVF